MYTDTQDDREKQTSNGNDGATNDINAGEGERDGRVEESESVVVGSEGE